MAESGVATVCKLVGIRSSLKVSVRIDGSGQDWSLDFVLRVVDSALPGLFRGHRWKRGFANLKGSYWTTVQHV